MLQIHDDTLRAPYFIFIIIFLIGLILSIRRHKKKKSTNSLLLVYLMLQGFLSGLGSFIAYYTEIWTILPIFGTFSIFFFIASVIILNIRLEKKVEMSEKIRSDLVRRTSHELKTPLISLFSSSQYLLDTYSSEMSEDILKFIKIINRGGKRLKILTDNLINAYNIEEKGLTLNKTKIDIVKSIKDCANDFIFTLERRELYLKQDLDESFVIEVDKTRIEQVILNLLSNAIKNTPPKGIIYIKLEHDNEFVDIIIKDTGIGLTNEEKEQLFNKFGKIERNGIDSKLDTEGSGLGLYISKEIVDLHGGQIIVKSQGRHKGSTFIVQLPITQIK